MTACLFVNTGGLNCLSRTAAELGDRTLRPLTPLYSDSGRQFCVAAFNVGCSDCGF